MTSAERLSAMIAKLEALIKEAEDEDAPKYQIAALYGRLQTALKDQRKLEGDEITEAQILKSDAWRNLFTRLLDVLARHPEALADVVSTLKRRPEPEQAADPNE